MKRRDLLLHHRAGVSRQTGFTAARKRRACADGPTVARHPSTKHPPSVSSSTVVWYGLATLTHRRCDWVGTQMLPAPHRRAAPRPPSAGPRHAPSSSAVSSPGESLAALAPPYPGVSHGALDAPGLQSWATPSLARAVGSPVSISAAGMELSMHPITPITAIPTASFIVAAPFTRSYSRIAGVPTIHSQLSRH